MDRRRRPGDIPRGRLTSDVARVDGVCSRACCSIPIATSRWSTPTGIAGRARAAIVDIVEDAQATLGAGIAWPWHPLEDAGEAEPPAKSVYFGASGVLWAMWYLQQAGAVSLRIEPQGLIDRVHEAYLDKPDTGEVVPSYLLGEVGILLVQWRLTGSRATADRLHRRDRTQHSQSHERSRCGPRRGRWSAHCTCFAGPAMRAGVTSTSTTSSSCGARGSRSEHAPCHVWTQDLYGKIVQLLGAGHGFAGNAYALLRGAALLPADRRDVLYDRCAETLRVTAQFDGDGANWPQSIGPPRPGRTHMLVQWCHGAPGIVTGLADYPASGRPTWMTC